MLEFLQRNAEWISTIVIATFTVGLWWLNCKQCDINLKQKNLILLEKRLDLKNKFERYVNDKLKNCLEPTFNIDVFKENFENMTNMAGDAFLLFNKDISERIMDLAKEFESLKTAIHYNIRKNRGDDLSAFESLGEIEKDTTKPYGQITHKKNLLVADMLLIMQGDKV